MIEPQWRSVRLACRLGDETRAAELKIRTDTIDPTLWRLEPDGSYRHEQLEAFGLAWLADQTELRLWTDDRNAEPQLFALRMPAESNCPDVQAATKRTRNTTGRTHSRHFCWRCNGELEEPLEDWQERADSWKGRNT